MVATKASINSMHVIISPGLIAVKIRPRKRLVYKESSQRATWLSQEPMSKYLHKMLQSCRRGHHRCSMGFRESLGTRHYGQDKDSGLPSRLIDVRMED